MCSGGVKWREAACAYAVSELLHCASYQFNGIESQAHCLSFLSFWHSQYVLSFLMKTYMKTSLNKFLSEHSSIINYIHTGAQRSSKTSSSCKTETLYPWAAISLSSYPQSDSCHFTFCFYEFYYFGCIISGIMQYFPFCDNLFHLA